MGEFVYFFIMAVLVFCAGWGAFRLVMARQHMAYFSFLVGVAVIATFFILKAEANVGWDAIGYVAFLMIFVMPALAGLVIGGAIGLWRRRRPG